MVKFNYLTFLFLIEITCAFGQPMLVKDINTLPESTLILAHAELNNELYFIAPAYSNANSSWLWKTDGIGTSIVAGSEGLNNFGSQMIVFNNKLFFTATSSSFGTELMMTDGSGSVSLVKDISPGSTSTSFIPEFTLCSGKLYFVVQENSPSQLNKQLWVSDGTGAGTILVKNFYSVTTSSFGCQNNKLVFQGGIEPGGKVWTSDGTESGTTIIYDQCCGGSAFKEFNGLTYFVSNGQLMSSDGTYFGTNQVSFSGANNFVIPGDHLTVYCNELYFPAKDDNTGVELWSYDETQVSLVSEIGSGTVSGNPRSLTVSGSKLYFIADDPVAGAELFTYECMAAGINLVKDINPGLTGSTPLEVSGNKIEFINPIGEKVLYAANDGVSGAEWWISDGTELGTYLVKDLNPGEAWSVVRTRFQVEFNGAFYFLGNDNRFGIEIFKTDGTDAGTLFFKDINPGNKSSDILRLFKPHNQLTFVANDGNGFDLWTSDGTYGGTQIVKEIGGPYSYNITRIFEFESRFIFAIQSNSGFELWISDGTSVGTNQVIDLNPGTGNGVNAVSIGINNQVLVFEGTGANGLGGELWRSDGTEAGTTFVKDIYPGAASSKPRNFILINGTLYFFALDANGMGIWTTDGTEMGTQKVKVLGKGTFIFGGQTKSYTYFGLIQNDSFDLWKSDGSSGGTQLVKNLQGNSVPFNFAAVGEKLVFSYDDGIFGSELWISDGTTAGTKILKDINPGQFSSIFQNNTAQAVGDKVYFAANNGVDGNELWETNGTELGTKLLFDLQPGGLSSNPHNLRADGKNLFLSAIHDGVDKMWHWNTSVGTPTLIGGSNPSNYTLIDNTVFFLADDGLSGRELWKYEFTKGELSNESDKVTGIEEDSQKNLSVYPNPTNGFLNVLNARTTKAIQVIDIMGRKVNFEMLESTGSIRIDLTTAQPGIYFLEVLSDNGVKGRVKVLKR